MGRLRIKQPIALRRQRQELKLLASKLQTPQQLALYLTQIPNPVVRVAVLNRIKPFLKFSISDPKEVPYDAQGAVT